MSEHLPDHVELSVHVDAKPETVFPFFTTPENMIRWMGIEADLDPRPGGTFRVSINGRDIAAGSYVEVSWPTRVVFTWGWEDEASDLPPGASRVEVTLTPDADGTLVTVRHSGLTAPQQDAHADGWNHFLPRLAIVAAGGDPGPDPWLQDE